MTAKEEIGQRFEQALEAQAKAEQALDKAASEFGEAKRVVNAARQLVNKLGDIINALEEVDKLEPQIQGESHDNNQTTELQAGRGQAGSPADQA